MQYSEANKLLGRLYPVQVIVVHGDGRGKRIGIPTANLDTGDEKLIPGCWSVRVQGTNPGDIYLPAAVNVGTRPTFESTDKLSHVEAYILDFSDDLYGQEIAVGVC